MPEDEIVSVSTETAVRIRGALPKKRRANLAKVTRQRVRWEIPLLLVLGAVLLVRLFVDYGITARFGKLHAAREQLWDVQARFTEAEGMMDRYYESRDTYFHVTWDDMTPEEIGLVDPADALDLLDRAVFPFTGRPLEKIELKDNAVTLEIAMDSLEAANNLALRLRDEPMVEYVSIRRGSGYVQTEDRPPYVSCRMEIRFRSADNRNLNGVKPALNTDETAGTPETGG